MKNFLFIGDSITDSHRLFTESSCDLGDGYVSMVRDMLPTDKYEITNRGHDGFTSEDVCRCLERDCLALTPDLVTILIGVNDIPVELYTDRPRIPAEFTQYCRSILERITSSGISSVILLEPFIFSSPAEYLLWHPLIRQESEILQSLASRFGAVFLPLHDRMNAQNDARGNTSLTTDGIHLSEAGSRLLASSWLSCAAPLL
ncbi:GDSL-type esterase/lipase family protein [Ruminococcus sp. OA3]|uniref:SGNH/GDSL hydrolase family protein n=1 Tax=Ruminococcus sp. OA3 TaxID=2914164 RepID=UPI001F06907B|nr:GDSL-type esterase/lipase family protein [Ruminococcus sp. OA3]MCH1984296.1 GDSL-type esterase/lipase family protein [Ruminococcus sp. OA3]